MAWGTYIVLLVLLLIFIYLCKTSHVFRYWTKMVYYHSIFMLVGLLALPVAIFRPLDPASIRPFQIFFQYTLRLTGMKVVKRNTEEFENIKDPAILLVNHQSNLDMTGVFEVSPYRATYLAKKELLLAGTFGIAAWLCGLIFIDRLNPEKAKKTLEQTVKIILKRKVKLWVFPEGTRNLKGGLLPFKKGAFYLAIQAQVPIYPVVFSSYRHFLDPQRRIFNSGKVIASALPPVSTKGLTTDDVADLTERVRDMMAAEFDRITTEIQAEARATNQSILDA